MSLRFVCYLSFFALIVYSGSAVGSRPLTGSESSELDELYFDGYITDSEFTNCTRLGAYSPGFLPCLHENLALGRSRKARGYRPDYESQPTAKTPIYSAPKPKVSAARNTALPGAVIFGEYTLNRSGMTMYPKVFAIGKDVAQANRNFNHKCSGRNCRVLIRCDQGGWYARVDDFDGGSAGYACGYPTRDAALKRAVAEMKSKGGSLNARSCDVGFVNGQQNYEYSSAAYARPIMLGANHLETSACYNAALSALR